MRKTKRSANYFNAHNNISEFVVPDQDFTPDQAAIWLPIRNFPDREQISDRELVPNCPMYVTGRGCCAGVLVAFQGGQGSDVVCFGLGVS